MHQLPGTLWFRVHDLADRLEVTADPFGAALAVGAMALGRAVRVEGEMSASLVDGLGRVTRQYIEWSPHAASGRAGPPGGEDDPRRRRGEHAASFFSCGLDSFYTLLRSLARYPEGDARRIRLAARLSPALAFPSASVQGRTVNRPSQ